MTRTYRTIRYVARACTMALVVTAMVLGSLAAAFVAGGVASRLLP